MMTYNRQNNAALIMLVGTRKAYKTVQAHLSTCYNELV